MSQAVSNASPLMAEAVGVASQDDVVLASLEFVREHLDMEVAYLSEFVGENLVFRKVSAPGFEDLAFEGGEIPLDQVYCRHILAGRLPEMIPDTAKEAFAQTIPMTHALPIGSHVSIPIKRNDGSNYGMFCCLSRAARPNLNARDLGVMRAFARLSSDTINTALVDATRISETAERIAEVLRDQDFDIVYQPIMDSQSRSPKGFEALCRFRGQPYRSPDQWFLESAAVGKQVELEICVIEKALQALHRFPPHVYISVNASPATISSGRLEDVFKPWPSERIVLELTEHEEVSSYELLLEKVELLRFQGIRIAIDDAGAGYAGLQQIVRLRPEIIKLDMSLTSNVDTDVVRRALASALKQFAVDTSAIIIAEGVETEAEFLALHELEVELMQGYLLGKPMDPEAALAMCSPFATVQIPG